MAQLYFYYSSMNAGKSTNLIQSAHNYEERGMVAKIFTYDALEVSSRIGIEKQAVAYGDNTNFATCSYLGADCIMIDEAQFLTAQQVDDLADIVDQAKIPVLCYGIRTDFMGELFEGSKRLLAIADKLIELKGVCHCGRKATMVLRLDKNKQVIHTGLQRVIGQENIYSSVCRKHHKLKRPYA